MPILGFIIGAILGFFIGAVYFVSITTALTATITNAPLAPLLAPIILAIWPVFLSVGAALATPLALAAVFHLVVVAIAYVVAALTTTTSGVAGQVNTAPSWAEELALGTIIGVNTLVNFFLLFSLTPFLAAIAAATSVVTTLVGILVALALLALPFVSGFVTLLGAMQVTYGAVGMTSGPRYQAVLGWMGLFQLFPMAWGGTLVFIPLMILEIIVSIATGWNMRMWIEWRTGAVIITGAPFADWWMGMQNTRGYSLGNFCFIRSDIQDRTPRVPLVTASNPETQIGIAIHETGHTLSMALLGNLFGIINFIDQTVIGRGPASYAETIAEGMLRESTRPWHGMFATVQASNVVPAETAPPASPLERVTPRALAIGAQVDLNGIGIVDPDSHPIGLIDPAAPVFGVLWFLSAVPPGSVATPARPNDEETSFIPDIPGEYEVRYGITDGIEGGNIRVRTSPTGTDFTRDTVIAVDVQPGGPYNTSINTPVSLDGSASSAGPTFQMPSGTDPALTTVASVDWSVIAMNVAAGVTPAFSFTAANNDITDFVSDTEGTYTLELMIRPRNGYPDLAGITEVQVTP